uniref:Uncharacterized protein n=1 Tax=Anguilla anguilla TaxID=7936 RepID=A0A0E9Q1A3_ANGAN
MTRRRGLRFLRVLHWFQYTRQDQYSVENHLNPKQIRMRPRSGANG